jgi:hypothetical protein
MTTVCSSYKLNYCYLSKVSASAVDRKELWRINIKQAIQGLFTAGTSEKKEKVGSKRGLKRLGSHQCEPHTSDVPIILQA